MAAGPAYCITLPVSTNTPEPTVPPIPTQRRSNKLNLSSAERGERGERGGEREREMYMYIILRPVFSFSVQFILNFFMHIYIYIYVYIYTPLTLPVRRMLDLHTPRLYLYAKQSTLLLSNTETFWVTDS